jgi:GT2 family glycosyltransferase
MPKVTLAGPTLRRYDLLQKLVESAEAGERKPDGYYFVDNGGDLVSQMSRGAIRLPGNAYVETPGRHVGVAGAWNRCLRASGDYTIITNDDVTMHPRTIAALVEAAESSDAEFLYPEFNPGAMFCVFLLKQSCVDRIGGFDEAFHPAYFEDNDYHRRMKLAGVKEKCVSGIGYDHVGSATLKTFSGPELAKHHEQFRRNREYYMRKWGGLPGHETVGTPGEVRG